jgi:hypothetical protein
VFKVRIVKDNGENGVVMFYGSKCACWNERCI